MKTRWSLLFRGWESDETLLLPRTKKLVEKANAKAVLVHLWDSVSHMVKLARLDSTTLQQRKSFEAAALLARRCWRGLNTEGASGVAASQEWRPTVWTHVYLCHLPQTMNQYGTLAPFWQYGFERRHARERRGLQVISHTF